MKKIAVRKDSYYDSVFLMLASRSLQGRPGIQEAVVAMATPVNRELLLDLGFAATELEALSANDLLVAVDAADAAVADAAIAAAWEALNKKASDNQDPAGLRRVGSLAAATQALPGANLALISVPGQWAAREARKCLERGIHTMLFSDNVSLEEEVALKDYASGKGLLMMGPDCGTAIINGIPLCFANVIRRGPIGLVAASGTGLQEVCCLIDQHGQGISQAIGTGGRDLKNAAVGGRSSLTAIAALGADPATRVLVLISKPPAPEVAAKVVAALEATGKPAVVHFLGLPPGRDGKALVYAANLEEAASLACRFAAGASSSLEARAGLAGREEAASSTSLAGELAASLGAGRRYLRGLYTGGTLADEALFLAHAALDGVWSNNHTDPDWVPKDPKRSQEHCVIDLGDDLFTVGRPHPMIDPEARSARILEEAADPACAVILFDVVLGHGAHPDPAGACAAAIEAARASAGTAGLPLFLASVTGSAGDPQGRDRQIQILQAAGARVLPSNYQAARLAVEVLQQARRLEA